MHSSKVESSTRSCMCRNSHQLFSLWLRWVNKYFGGSYPWRMKTVCNKLNKVVGNYYKFQTLLAQTPHVITLEYSQLLLLVFTSHLLETRLRQDDLKLGGLRLKYARPLQDRDSSMEYRAEPQGQVFFYVGIYKHFLTKQPKCIHF